MKNDCIACFKYINDSFLLHQIDRKPATKNYPEGGAKPTDRGSKNWDGEGGLLIIKKYLDKTEKHYSYSIEQLNRAWIRWILTPIINFGQWTKNIFLQFLLFCYLLLLKTLLKSIAATPRLKFLLYWIYLFLTPGYILKCSSHNFRRNR